MLLRCIRVAVGLPAAAAGKVLATVLDKAHNIAQRIAEEHPDLMRKFCRTAQLAGKLSEHIAHIRCFARFRQAVALLPQKALHLFICQHGSQPAFAVDIHKIPVVEHAGPWGSAECSSFSPGAQGRRSRGSHSGTGLPVSGLPAPGHTVRS